MSPVNFGYNADGLLRQITQGARTATIDYDAQFRPEVLTDALNRQVRFTYDLNGRIKTQTLPDLRVITFDYDDNGNLVSLTPPTRPAPTFSYTPVDLAGAYTPPAVPGTGATIYRYNRDTQIIGIDRPDGLTTGFEYDAAGRLFRLGMGGDGPTTYGYDSAGRVATVTTADGQGLTYSYDGPLVTAEQWSVGTTGTVSRTFGADLVMTSETVSSTPPVTFSYDSAGLVSRAGQSVVVTRTDLGAPAEVQVGGVNGVTETLRYTPSLGDLPGAYGEPLERRVRVAALDPFFNADPAFWQIYRRDHLGRITTLEDTVLGTSHLYTYGYDDAGRLTAVDQDGLLLARYRYDGNGNRYETTTPLGTQTATVDDQDRLQTFGTSAFTYTANGERRTKTTLGETTTYTYDELGNLTRVQLPDGRDIRHVTDGRGRRVRKLVNGVPVQGWLWLDQLRVAAELDGTGAVRLRFVYGSRPNVPDYLVTSSGQTLKVVADHLGSPRLLVNVSTGALAQQLAYDAYGTVILDTAPGVQPLGFAGGLYDTDTGLVRFGARDYDPATGTWTAKDPIGFGGGDPNLYGYVIADPINLFDPAGLDWLSTAAEGFAGFGDHLSFGMTGVVRDALGWGVDQCSAAYGVGSAAGVAFDLASAAASAGLTGAAANVSEAGMRQLRRDARNVLGLPRGSGTFAHHVNTLRGHPGGGGAAVLPTAGLPASLSNHPWNLAELTAAQHASAHARSARADALARGMGIGNGLAAGARTGRTADAAQCGCK